MALQVATIGELPQRDIPPATTSRSDEKHALQTKIRTLVGFWERLTGAVESPSHMSSKTQHIVTKELWKPTKSAAEEVGSLPRYEECLYDLPPDYNATDSFAYARCMQDTEIATNGIETRTQGTRSCQLLAQAFDVKVDFNCEHSFRSHAKKKKAAAKAAAKSKWADSDNEEKKDEGPAEGGDNNGSGGGGDGAGGGSDPPGGDDGNGGGDDGDEWNFGGSKKSKKGKKNKTEVEEEQDKAAEEDTAAAADTATVPAEAEPVDGIDKFPGVTRFGR